MTPLMFVYNIFLIMIYTCTMVLFFTLFVRNKKEAIWR